MPKEKINIVWLKRDLRLSDHEPISLAIDKGLPVLLLYIFEPDLMSLPESSDRHWRFAFESLLELFGNRLKLLGKNTSILHGSAENVFEDLIEMYDVEEVYSHLEVGLKAVSDRDELIRKLLDSNDIPWLEFSPNGIQRGIKNRKNWEEQRNAYLESNLMHPNLKVLKTVSLPEEFTEKYSTDALIHLMTPNTNFQQGGESVGRGLLHSFLERRHQNYIQNISQSTLSFETCSRLSPYLAYGCLSVREVYQEIKKSLSESYSEDLNAFLLRLFWRSHYMQKLETEWELEFEPTNRALSNLDREQDKELYEAWANGKTGYPYIDATIRCLEETGYANFRMRATLVTFATFTLWQDWKKVATHLASLFLDFEPGIHYPQMQLQAGLTAYHLLRIYSPSAQSNKHDKNRAFVKKWLPELRDIPNHLIPKPWTMTEAEQEEYNCKIGADYPNPIVAFEISSTLAKAHYWKSRQRQTVFDHLPAIFEKHSLPKDIPNYMHALKLNVEEYRKAKRRLGKK